MDNEAQNNDTHTQPKPPSKLLPIVELMTEEKNPSQRTQQDPKIAVDLIIMKAHPGDD